jgi:catechol 2,3-dioxygenase-like lactoylglutathione lyase family enzyme
MIAKSISVRYLVHDVDAAIEFYTRILNFKTVMHPMPEFAILSLDDFRLFLSKPSGRSGGGQEIPDGTSQTSGGWNRISREIEDLNATVEN